MISFTDIVELAKAGYKPKDVKELIEMSKEADKEKEIDNPVLKESSDASGAESPAAPDAEDKTDYKKLYEKTQKELNEVQKVNRSKDVSTDEDYISDEDVIKSWITENIKR